jgi:hypothetical protein
MKDESRPATGAGHPKARARGSLACPRALAIVRIADWAQLPAASDPQLAMSRPCERRSRNDRWLKRALEPRRREGFSTKLAL